MARHKPFLTTDELEEGGYLKIENNQVTYLASKIRRKITDPEEKVRAEYYLELIKKYKYPENRIQPNQKVPGRKPDVFADLVVFEDDEKKKPYIVVECKKDGISQAEIRKAIEQAFGYANSLRAQYAVLVAGTVRIAFDIAGFKPSEREKNIIADIPERYGKVIKYRFKKGDSENDLKMATREELLAKFQQCHDTLWEGGKRNPAEAFDEMSKVMFCKIWDERFITKKGEYYKFQIGTHETLKEITQRIRGIYAKAQKMEPGVFTEKIKAEDPIIYSVVELLQGISLARTELDIKGEAFEHFLGGVFRQAMGQYFTPRPIVKFMVDMLEPNEDDKIIDPACGSGGFLLYTLERVKTYLEETLASRDALDRWKDFGLYQLYGIEINSQLARVAMMNMILHEDGHSNIENNDALDDPSTFHPRRDIKPGKYTLLLTNPPFGAVVKIREHSYLANYELGAKVKSRNRQNTEILFIEKCLDYLKQGGRMGIVLPDGVLTNSSLQYVRDFITDKAQILAVVSLPQTAFRRPHAKGGGGAGSGVKASLLFLRKKKEGEKWPENYPIFMALAEHVGYDSTGRPDKNEFPDIVKAYQEFRKKKKIDFFVETPLCFSVKRGELEDALNPTRYADTRSEIKHWGNIEEYVVLKYEPVHLKEQLSNAFDLIRIDDLDNDCFEVTNLRTCLGNDLRGTYQKVQAGDLLVTRLGPGILNKKSLVCPQTVNTTIASNEFIRLTPKSCIDPYGLLAILKTDYYVRLMFSKGRGATPSRFRLSREDFGKLPFPDLSKDKIALLGKELRRIYKTKKEKERKAAGLLDSIDDYVLSALGVEFPELEDEQFYTITFANVKGDRIDPFYYQPKYQKLYEALERGKFELVRISQVIDTIEYGLMPTQDYAKSAKEGVPMIRVTNITRKGEINIDDVKFIPYSTPNLENKILEGGEVLVVQCGNTTGKTTLVNDQFKGYTYGSFILSLRANNLVLPQYLEIILAQRLIQMQIWRSINVTTVRPSTSKPKVLNVRIPLPSLPIQQKIAEEVKSRRERAKALIKEAKEITMKAKEEVEGVIMGEKSK